MARNFKVKVKVPAKLLASPKKLREIILATLESTMEVALARVQGELQKKAPVDAGFLANSIQTETTIEKGKIVGTVFMLPYGVFQDKGTRSGKFPAFDPILQWVKRKNLDLPPRADTKRRKGKRSQRAERQKAVAWAIAITIFKNGIEAKGFIDQSLDEAKNDITEFFKNTLDGLTKVLKKKG